MSLSLSLCVVEFIYFIIKIDKILIISLMYYCSFFVVPVKSQLSMCCEFVTCAISHHAKFE